MDINVLTIATGDRKFVQFAYNLALTLRASAPRCKIAVVTDQRLEPCESDMFDEIIKPKHYHPHQIKCNLYSYLPRGWKHCLFIDADTVFNHHRWELSDEFEKLKDEDIAFARPPQLGEMPWATIADTKDHYKIKGDFPLITSAAIFFKRGEPAKKFFKKSGSIWGKFRRITADEIYFNSALALTKTDPGFIDLYFPQTSQDAHGILYGHPWFSLGWNNTPQQLHIFKVVVDKARKALSAPIAYPVHK